METELTSCVACGGIPIGTYRVSLWGEATCSAHVIAGDCVLCGRPRADPPGVGWATFTRDTLRCPTCVRHGIETQAAARGHIPGVRAAMAAMGVELIRRVRVTLVVPDALRNGWPTDAVLFGMTHHQVSADGAADVLGIQVAAGLTTTHFGATLAHEIGHAWLVERGAVGLEPTVAEGLCELFAGAWLKKQRTVVADALREAMATNPDPVYGGGYRLVRAAVVRHGIRAVLNHLVTRRTLPQAVSPG
ncbi:protein DA1 [Kutzneria sp. NPDC052558]|uniref:protein DA1 n=1 Tax=Kutzneria sp. NPDC052558 TaxID=3364121 RepID=UPI0037CBF809